MHASNRPLSPHLQIYRLPITALTSITHRITGVGLAGGAVLAVWWLVAIAKGPEAYQYFHAAATSLPGQGVLLGFVWASCYHLLNGLRHLVWDLGFGFEISTAAKSSWAVVAGSVLLTLFFWTVKG